MRRKHRSPRRPAVAALAVAIALTLTGCGTDSETGRRETQAPERSGLVLATTTSTQDSGLLDELIPAFEEAEPRYDVKVIAVGSGQALALGEKKDADVLLVHSKASELAFMERGFGADRAEVFYNDFVVLGPPNDPGRVKGAPTALDAFQKIAAAQAPFISRGDDSGTHSKEKSLWTSATVDPAGQSWYVSAGQGMSEVLVLASEKGAYTLADRATFLAMKDQLRLEVVAEGDAKLRNQYAVITVRGARNEAGARAFYEWLQTTDAQDLVRGFGREEYGKSLFVPNAR